MTTVVNIDYVLLAVLLFLTLFACCYCVYRVLIMNRSGQIEILLKPTRVLFSHKKEGDCEQLRTVVAYQNPFTGDYCVRKSRLSPQGYTNRVAGGIPSRPPSGEYEPLRLPEGEPTFAGPDGSDGWMEPPAQHIISPIYGDNSVNKTWNWNYKEYQI